MGGAPKGDLYLVVSVRPHSTFTRKGDDLYVDVAVPFHVMVLEGETLVPTLKGTRSSCAYRRRRKTDAYSVWAARGCRASRIGRGALFATATAALPTNLTITNANWCASWRRGAGPSRWSCIECLTSSDIQYNYDRGLHTARTIVGD